MADTRAKSAKIKVYPSAYRKNVTVNGESNTYNPESSLNTEVNLTSFTNRLTAFNREVGIESVSSFVIKHEPDVENGHIVFCIHGYWFDLTDVNVIRTALGTDKPVWAYIHLLNDNSNFNNFILTGYNSSAIIDNLDNNGDFLGINFLDAKPTISDPTTQFALQLLTADNVVPASSYLMFTSKQVKDSYQDSDMPISQRFTTVDLYVDYVHADGGTVDAEDITCTDELTANDITANTITMNSGGTVTIEDGTIIFSDDGNGNHRYIEGDTGEAVLTKMTLLGDALLRGTPNMPGSSAADTDVYATGIKKTGQIVANNLTLDASSDITTNTTDKLLTFVSNIAQGSNGKVTYTTKQIQEATGGSSAKAGIVSTGAQSFAGKKTFDSDVVINGDLTVNTSGKTITGNLSGIATKATQIKMGDYYYTLSWSSDTLTFTKQ